MSRFRLSMPGQRSRDLLLRRREKVAMQSEILHHQQRLSRRMWKAGRMAYLRRISLRERAKLSRLRVLVGDRCEMIWRERMVWGKDPLLEKPGSEAKDCTTHSVSCWMFRFSRPLLAAGFYQNVSWQARYSPYAKVRVHVNFAPHPKFYPPSYKLLLHSQNLLEIRETRCKMFTVDSLL
jgi:hypothetical protein